MPSPMSEVQASGWCCMRSTFLQILLLFSYECMYRLFASMWRPLVSVITLLCCDYSSSLSVVSCTFSALCVHSKFGHHPHPLGYLCTKFCFCRSLHCWASQWRKTAYSITHPLTQSSSLFDAPGTKACASE